MRRQEERWRRRRGQRQQKHPPSLEQPPQWLASLPLIWILGMGWAERLSQGGRAPLWASGPHLHVSCLSCPGMVSAGCCHAPVPIPTSLPPSPPASVPFWGGPCLPHTVLMSYLSHLYPMSPIGSFFSLASASNPQTHFSLVSSPGSERLTPPPPQPAPSFFPVPPPAVSWSIPFPVCLSDPGKSRSELYWWPLRT